MDKTKTVYPYIPNSAPDVQARMMEKIGISDLRDLFREIPDHLKFQGDLDLPEPILDECSLRRHIEDLLNRNGHCGQYVNFLGAGCASHYVPAVCDEINGRGEFLTAYAAEFYADHGKWQALFEFSSLMAELLDMEVVSGFLYDGVQAMATSLRMACRMTGRSEVWVSGTVSPDTRLILENYMKGITGSQIDLHFMEYDRRTGAIDFDDLKARISNRTAAVLIEVPSFLGGLEPRADEIGRLARAYGAEFVVSTDPICLGAIAPPAAYGATITCGDYHSLGLHLQFGGGQGGFIATNGDMRYVMEFKDKMYGLTRTTVPGEYGFANILFGRTSFGSREKAREFTGTSNGLWAITAGVYLALMGPRGMAEIGRTIMQKARYAAGRLSRVKGVELGLTGPFFKEFVVNFDATGRSVAEINRALLDYKIFGGKDISTAFPDLGQSALYCVTEVIRQDEIDALVRAVEEIVA